jgi:ribosome-associated translation inhibitor RaiA
MLILGGIDDDDAEHVQARIGQAVGALDVRRVVVTFHRADPGPVQPFRAEVRMEVAGLAVAAQVAARTRSESIDALADRLARQLIRLAAHAQIGQDRRGRRPHAVGTPTRVGSVV